MTDIDMIEAEQMEKFLKEEFTREADGIPTEYLSIVPDTGAVKRLKWLRDAKRVGLFDSVTKKKEQNEQAELSSWAQEVYTKTSEVE